LLAHQTGLLGLEMGYLVEPVACTPASGWEDVSSGKRFLAAQGGLLQKDAAACIVGAINLRWCLL
jgi:hypothetical protein